LARSSTSSPSSYPHATWTAVNTTRLRARKFRTLQPLRRVRKTLERRGGEEKGGFGTQQIDFSPARAARLSQKNDGGHRAARQSVRARGGGEPFRAALARRAAAGELFSERPLGTPTAAASATSAAAAESSGALLVRHTTLSNSPRRASPRDRARCSPARAADALDGRRHRRRRRGTDHKARPPRRRRRRRRGRGPTCERGRGKGGGEGYAKFFASTGRGRKRRMAHIEKKSGITTKKNEVVASIVITPPSRSDLARVVCGIAWRTRASRSSSSPSTPTRSSPLLSTYTRARTYALAERGCALALALALAGATPGLSTWSTGQLMRSPLPPCTTTLSLLCAAGATSAKADERLERKREFKAWLRRRARSAGRPFEWPRCWRRGC